jgi:probable HAF family extracellular repeat protein
MEASMKSKSLAWIIAMTLCAVLALPAWLAAQEPAKGREHHRYKLIDLETFGGATSYLAQGFNGTGSNSGVLDNQGTVVGAADTATPDPNLANSNGFFPSDGFIAHAFRWQRNLLTDLGALPGGNNSFASWISANGLTAGFSENGVIDPQFGVPQVNAVLWKDDEIINLGGYFSSASAVNNRGQVVGNTLNTGTLPALNVRAFLWQGGVMRDLGTLGGDSAQAFFVNERGQVSGVSYTNSAPSPLTGIPIQDPYLWENGTMLDIGALGGTFGVPNAMNNRGQVVGQSNLAGDANFHPFLWNKGVLTDLGTFGGDFGSAYWINEAGDIVGWATTPSDQLAHAFLWTKGEMKDLGTVNGQPCAFAQNINSKDQVVGVAFDCITDGGHAWLWENGGPIVDLNTLIPRGSTLTLELAENINDRGEIAGIGSPPGCANPFACGHAFVLVPCDEDNADEKDCEFDSEDAPAAEVAPSEPAPQIPSAAASQGKLSPDELVARYRSLITRRHHSFQNLPPK